jgi:hypothetical protein
VNKILLSLLVILLIMLPAGCGLWHGGSVAEGNEFTLGLGDRANVRGEGLSLVFADVQEDSRCATGVVCIWQGQVRCSVLLTKNGATYTETFTQSGLTSEPATESALGYLFTFRIEPYPEEGKDIAPQDYRLTIKVESQ